jgi:predicted lipase
MKFYGIFLIFFFKATYAIVNFDVKLDELKEVQWLESYGTELASIAGFGYCDEDISKAKYKNKNLYLRNKFIGTDKFTIIGTQEHTITVNFPILSSISNIFTYTVMTQDNVILIIFSGTKDSLQLGVEYFKTKKLNKSTTNSFKKEEPDFQTIEYFDIVYDKTKEKLYTLFVEAYNRFQKSQYDGVPRVYFIGHSLGGAIATIFSVKLKQLFFGPADYYSVLISFGSPRVGDSEFANRVNEEVDRIFRVINFEDIVPSLIPCERSDDQLCMPSKETNEGKIYSPWNIKGLFIVRNDITHKEKIYNCRHVDENPKQQKCTFLQDKQKLPIKPLKHTIYFNVDIGSICTETGDTYQRRNNSMQDVNSGFLGFVIDPLIKLVYRQPVFGRKRKH